MKKESVKITSAKKKQLSVASIIGMSMGAEITNYNRQIKNAPNESVRRALIKARDSYLEKTKKKKIEKEIGKLNIEIQRKTAELEALNQLKIKPTVK